MNGMDSLKNTSEKCLGSQIGQKMVEISINRADGS